MRSETYWSVISTCHAFRGFGNHREAVQHRSPGSRSAPGVLRVFPPSHPSGQRRSGFCVRDLQDITLPRSGRVELSGSGRVLGKTTKDADWQVFAPSPGLRARLSQRESEVKNPLRRCPLGCDGGKTHNTPGALRDPGLRC
jgi:hypothetical protein